jgi:hypothetical protein
MMKQLYILLHVLLSKQPTRDQKQHRLVCSTETALRSQQRAQAYDLQNVLVRNKVWLTGWSTNVFEVCT